MVLVPRAQNLPAEGNEVPHVLGCDRPSLARSSGQEGAVVEALEVSTLDDRAHVVPAVAKRPRDPAA